MTNHRAVSRWCDFERSHKQKRAGDAEDDSKHSLWTNEKSIRKVWRLNVQKRVAEKQSGDQKQIGTNKKKQQRNQNAKNLGIARCEKEKRKTVESSPSLLIRLSRGSWYESAHSDEDS